ncbi:MM3350-like domain-containing protein [Tricladium varicosporioides]|nr:MM3350-like domain-containing protein [Hymenoscyphus varicosporioides]
METVLKKSKCAVCSAAETSNRKLLYCGRCKQTKYCSKSCQQEDWKGHKRSCKAQNYLLKVDLYPEEIRDPSISRTLSCPANANFDQLHDALQEAFGYTNIHTYDFKIKDPNAEPEPVLDPGMETHRKVMWDRAQKDNSIYDWCPRQNLLRIVEQDPLLPDKGIGIDFQFNSRRRHTKTPEVYSDEIKLYEVFDDKEYLNAPIQYEYDFNESWVHDVMVIGRAEGTSRFQCLNGEGHGVAEDVGGVHGWLELRKAYNASKPTKWQEERKLWYETEAFNKDVEGLESGRDRFWDRDAINRTLSVRIV